MKIHLEELQLAQLYTEANPFEGLSDEQVKVILGKGRRLKGWFQNYQGIHYLISFLCILFFLMGDFIILLWLPRLFLVPHEENGTGIILLTGVVVSIIRGWLTYCMIHYSIHEGASHELVFPPRGIVSRRFNQLANNLCRLALADPDYYSESHLSHHAKFGTKDDAEFLNFVFPRRFWISLIPFSVFMNFSDFIAHRPLAYTKSRWLSAAISTCYNGIYFYFTWQLFGPLYTVIVAVLASNITFYFDRFRQFSEHNLMPIEQKNGARSFGLGFWGLLIGGGPWGQPCHWIHHLVPSIPWYQQLILHRYVRKILTPHQRQQYLLQPVIGYPKLWWRLCIEPNVFARRIQRKGDVAVSFIERTS